MKEDGEKAQPFRSGEDAFVTAPVRRVTSTKQLGLFHEAIGARGVRKNTVDALTKLAGMFCISPAHTKIDVWEMVAEHPMSLTCDEDFDNLKAIKRALSSSAMPSPDWAIREYVDFIGRDDINVQTIKHYLGYRGGTQCLRRAHEYAQSAWELRRTDAVPRAQLRKPRKPKTENLHAKKNRPFREALESTNTRRLDRQVLQELDNRLEIVGHETLGDVWSKLEELRFPLKKREDFEKMCSYRRALRVTTQPFSRWIRDAFIAHVGEENINSRALIDYLGINPRWCKDTQNKILGLTDENETSENVEPKCRATTSGFKGDERTYYDVFRSHGLTQRSWNVLRQVEKIVAVDKFDTTGDVWRKLEKQKFNLKTSQDYFWMLSVRKALMVSNYPYPDWILEALPAVIGPENINVESVRVHLGWQTISENLERLRRMTETVHQSLSKQMNAPAERIITIFDEPVRGRIKELLDQSERPLAECLVGRVLDAPEGPIQYMYALVMIAQNIGNRRLTTTRQHFVHLKRSIEIFREVDPFDPEVTDQALEAYVLNGDRDETRATRMNFARCHFAQRNLIDAFIDSFLYDLVDELKVLVPAPFKKSKNLARMLGEIRAETEDACKARRASKVGELIPRVSHIVDALDHRFAQVEVPFFRFAEAINLANGGVNPAVNRDLEVEVPVVLPDGMVQPVRQVVRFQLHRKSGLLRSILQQSPDALWAKERLGQIEGHLEQCGFGVALTA